MIKISLITICDYYTQNSNGHTLRCDILREVNKTKIPKLRLKIRLGAQMNDDNISIITYSKDYLSILHCSSDTSVHYRFAEIIAWQDTWDFISAYT